MSQLLNLASTDFIPSEGNILVKPVEQVTEEQVNGLVFNIEKESLVNRPTQGKVVRVFEENDSIFSSTYLNCNVVWPNESGIDLTFTDGDFILLTEKSILGTY